MFLRNCSFIFFYAVMRQRGPSWRSHVSDLIEDMRKKHIETQIGTYTLHLQPSYRKTRKVGKLVGAEKWYKNLRALPMCHSMSKEEQERVVSEVAKSLHSS